MGNKQSKKYAEDSGEEEQELQLVEKEEYQDYKGLGAERLDSEDDSKVGGSGGNIDVSSSEEEITRKVVKKAAPRKLGPPQDKEDSSKGKVSSSKPASKKPTAVKKKFMESSDEENPPPKKSKARQVVVSGDDSDFEVESIAARPRTAGMVNIVYIVYEVVFSIASNTYISFSFYILHRNCALENVKTF